MGTVPSDTLFPVCPWDCPHIIMISKTLSPITKRRHGDGSSVSLAKPVTIGKTMELSPWHSVIQILLLCQIRPQIYHLKNLKFPLDSPYRSLYTIIVVKHERKNQSKNITKKEHPLRVPCQ